MEPKKIDHSDIDPYNEEIWDNGEQINYGLMKDNQFNKRFVIPVGGLTREQAEDVIMKLMRSYHEDAYWT